MNGLMEYRCRTIVSPDEIAEKVGRVLTEADYNVRLTGAARVYAPTGRLLCVYLPGAIPVELRESTWPILTELKAVKTANRGLAGGSPRVEIASGKRSEAKRVASAIVGSFEPQGPRKYCRLTAWTGQETEKYRILWPLLRHIGEELKHHVPDRWEAQMAEVARTHPDWIIPGTPFSTVTVNNTYETGVHKDAGDLDAGFSTLAVLRRGEFKGGHLIFPEYRVGVDLQDGDLILMDAHAWHGNSWLDPRPQYSMNGTRLDKDTYERVSVVSYFRTKITGCDSLPDENAKRRLVAEHRAQVAVGE